MTPFEELWFQERSGMTMLSLQYFYKMKKLMQKEYFIPIDAHHEIIRAWARTIIRIPNECSRAKEDSRKSFSDLIGMTPEEFLKRP